MIHLFIYLIGILIFAVLLGAYLGVPEKDMPAAIMSVIGWPITITLIIMYWSVKGPMVLGDYLKNRVKRKREELKNKALRLSSMSVGLGSQ